MTSSRIITCSCGCGTRGRHGGRGWIHACYSRWIRAGKPAEGPSSRAGSVNLHTQRKLGRLEDYAWLRTSLNLSIDQAAVRVSVCRRTAERYEADLKARAA